MSAVRAPPRDGAPDHGSFFLGAVSEEDVPRRALRWIGRVLLGLLAVLLLLLATGAIYNVAAEARDRRRFPPPGRRLDVAGTRLHISCLGAGSPTVVFDSGLGLPGLGWALVQPEVARFTHACVYGRAGSGWSDPSGASSASNVTAATT